MLETKKARQIAEAVVALPGVAAALYAAIAYDNEWDGEGLLVRMFSACVDLQIRVLGGDTYSPKLAMLTMIVPLSVPPAVALRLWLLRRDAAAPSTSTSP